VMVTYLNNGHNIPLNFREMLTESWDPILKSWFVQVNNNIFS